MVQIKKKVTLKTKTSQEPPQTPPVPSSGEEKKKKPGKTIGWIAALGILVILAVVFYDLFNSSDDYNVETSTMPVQVDSAIGVSVDDGRGELSAGEASAQDSTSTCTAGNVEKQDAPLASGEDALTTTPQSSHNSTPSTISQRIQSSEANNPIVLSGTLEQKAKDVIRGNYGNGETRKQKLGDQYAEIQAKVNEMYRNGLVR